jgi:hypothetical protein
MSSKSSVVNINITNEKVVYTNIPYRKEDITRNKNYIEGINRALYSVLSNDVINLLKESFGNVEGAKSAVYDAGGQGYSFIDSATTEGLGIAADVNRNIAEEILAVAKDWCPVDTGRLRDSGRVEEVNGVCYVVFDAPYAWYVHEFTWRNISREKNPYAQSKWLEKAVQYVKKIHYLI